MNQPRKPSDSIRIPGKEDQKGVIVEIIATGKRGVIYPDAVLSKALAAKGVKKFPVYFPDGSQILYASDKFKQIGFFD